MKTKKAITELIAYVLLIGLAITLSILVYNWLRFYVMPYEAKACPDGVSLILQEYSCSAGKINITVKNKGLFKIDGYLVKVNNETDYSGKPKGLPVHLLDSVLLQNPLNPSDMHSKEWDYKTSFVRIVEIEIEPFRIDNGKTIYCDKAIIKQTIRSVDCL
jgi:hypothetical protein